MLLQEEHWLELDPVHDSHKALQLSQVFVTEFPYVLEGQVATQVPSNRNLPCTHSVQLVSAGPKQRRHYELQESHTWLLALPKKNAGHVSRHYPPLRK